MNSQFFVELLNKLDPWFYDGVGVVLLIGICYFFYLSTSGVKRFSKAISDVLGRDERIKELQEKIETANIQSFKNDIIAQQMSSSMFNIKSFIETINEIKTEPNPDIKVNESLSLIQRLLDQLANDVKTTAGDEHRCGLWIANSDQPLLYLRFISAGFPKHYKTDRYLEINDSVAGRTFRKNQTINLKDVKSDKDWKPSPFTENIRYKSLICIPVGTFGVLTIDGREEMDEECELIGEVHAKLLESAIIEYDQGLRMTENLQKIFAERVDNGEEVG